MTTSAMLRKIHQAGPDELMTTRDFLIYGKRSSVDQFLFRAVRSGLLTRWARGVFSKDASRPPTVRQLAEIKARAFKKRIIEHPRDTAHRLGLVKCGNEDLVYQVNGRTSSFMTCHGRITLRGACQKRMYLADTHTASAIRGLCNLGEGGFGDKHIKQVTQWFVRKDKLELQVAAAWMPWWLSDYMPKPDLFDQYQQMNVFEIVKDKAIKEWAFSSGAA
ncbi:MAG TPA: DUF6088 family protein [Chroococcales cyanobacterium]